MPSGVRSPDSGFSVTGILHRATDAFELPKDIMLNLPRTTIIGNLQVIIENHRGIREYEADKVSVAVGTGLLVVKGWKLRIASIVKEEIVIDGRLTSVEFLPDPHIVTPSKKQDREG